MLYFRLSEQPNLKAANCFSFSSFFSHIISEQSTRFLVQSQRSPPDDDEWCRYRTHKSCAKTKSKYKFNDRNLFRYANQGQRDKDEMFTKAVCQGRTKIFSLKMCLNKWQRLGRHQLFPVLPTIMSADEMGHSHFPTGSTPF